jgi:glycogen debranching enzyme
MVHDAVRPGQPDHVPADPVGWPGAHARRPAPVRRPAGPKVDEFRDEEPGKILHEIRQGELTILGEKPHSPYYGTADATPLYLILMSEYWRYSDDTEFVRARWRNVTAALEWMDRYGDRDSDGYVEYQTQSSQGLGKQCWKDSWDGVQFHDGRMPFLPIATAEIQGYVYDAKLRIAELAERLMDGERLGARLRREADELYDRFNQDFWSSERGGYYVAGLDGDKRPIDTMTSNMGHLLWSGIVPAERTAAIRDHLMSDDMFSGWGVRTMSRTDAGYNPIGYHTGTIWPHDNSIVAMGLARCGYREEANRIAAAQLAAASFSNYRLPEAFAGYDRRLARFPVPYPTACSPQAWATGAPFTFAKVMLGLEATTVRCPWIPACRTRSAGSSCTACPPSVPTGTWKPSAQGVTSALPPCRSASWAFRSLRILPSATSS